MRAGQYLERAEGYAAFVPAPLPPNPPINMDGEMVLLLSGAVESLGRLDGITYVLPNPDLFVAMYIRQEAVLSSQIEGTQSTLEDVLQFEIDETGQEIPKDVTEVVNYIKAMKHGLERLQELPVCLRLLREIHGILLAGVRGRDRSPGEFRKIQNWIGEKGCNLSNASFIPPPVPQMQEALDNLEKFMHQQTDIPFLLQCGLIQAQFETIHPFLDGNGRIGRLLVTFLLCQRGSLQEPLLYLSAYFKAHRLEYYERLMAIRDRGDWEGWLKFFLKGVYEVSKTATETARAILNLRENHRQLIARSTGVSNYGLLLHDLLLEQPIVNVRLVENNLGCSYSTAKKVVEQFVELELLNEVTGYQRNRRYRYDRYLALF